jgi:hypothetical protein
MAAVPGPGRPRMRPCAHAPPAVAIPRPLPPARLRHPNIVQLYAFYLRPLAADALAEAAEHGGGGLEDSFV